MEKEQGESVESPWLLCRSTHYNAKKVYCSVTHPHRTFRYHKSTPLSKFILNYSYGWVLIEDKDRSRFKLFNPKTRQIIHLPVLPSAHKRRFNVGILWLAPENPMSKVLLFETDQSTILYYNIHGKKWIEVSYQTEAQKLIGDSGDVSVTIKKPVNCNGRLYAMLLFSKGIKVVEIDIVEETQHLQMKPLEAELPVEVIHSKSSILNEHDWYEWWLAESQGELFAINIVRGLHYVKAVDVRVFRWDFNSVERGWRYVKGSEIKYRAFFISDIHQPLSCTITGQEFEGGRVYYVTCISKYLYSYDVEDGSVQVSMPSISSLPSVWLMMPNPREDIEDVVKKKKTSTKSFSEWRPVNFLDLPYDIIEIFAKKIRPADCKNLRATCKACCQLTPPIRWRTTGSLVQAQPHPLCPWLMFSKGDRTVHHFIDLKFGGTFTIEADKLFRSARIHYSKNGWTLLANAHGNLFFYNPFTKEVFKLPEAPEYTAACDSFCFTGIPSSPECIVLGVTSHSACYFDARQQHWRSVCLREPGLPVDCTPIFVKGSFYISTVVYGTFQELEFRNGRLMVFGGFRSPYHYLYHQKFLLEWDGKLAAVFINPKFSSLQVFTLRETTRRWERVWSLGKSSFFLSSPSAFSINTNIRELENKIYLSNIYDEDKIVFYCLETGSFGYTRSEVKLNSFEGTKEHLSSCWIQPSC